MGRNDSGQAVKGYCPRCEVNRSWACPPGPRLKDAICPKAGCGAALERAKGRVGRHKNGRRVLMRIETPLARPKPELVLREVSGG